jgi:hypothetical protein
MNKETRNYLITRQIVLLFVLFYSLRWLGIETEQADRIGQLLAVTTTVIAMLAISAPLAWDDDFKGI